MISSVAPSLACKWQSSLCVHAYLISFYKDTGHIGLSPVHINSFYLKYLFKGRISKHSHVLSYWGLAQYMTNFRGTQFTSNKQPTPRWSPDLNIEYFIPSLPPASMF